MREVPMTIDNVMRHGAYEAATTFDAAAGLFNGEVINLRDVVTFQGTSIDELRQAFAASIANYLALCAARGEPSESPFSRTVTGEWDSDDHHAVETAQAARLLAQASLGGLRFDAYFAPADAAWARPCCSDPLFDEITLPFGFFMQRA
jgi:predicted HicB family RNase H-like nuclease